MRGGAAAAGIPLQINSLVTADTGPDLEELSKVVKHLGVARWSLLFLVSLGRGRTLRPLSPADCERTLRWLARRAPSWPFVTTTTEAPHYRRVVVETMREAGRTCREIRESAVARSFAIRDGNGIVFIAADGDVTPSGFLPLAAANVRAGDVGRDLP